MQVTAAGHGLDGMQIKLASEGKHVLSWPWSGGWLGGTDIQVCFHSPRPPPRIRRRHSPAAALPR